MCVHASANSSVRVTIPEQPVSTVLDLEGIFASRRGGDVHRLSGAVREVVVVWRKIRPDPAAELLAALGVDTNEALDRLTRAAD